MEKFLSDKKNKSSLSCLCFSRHQCHPLHPADGDEDPQECPKGKEGGDINTGCCQAG